MVASFKGSEAIIKFIHFPVYCNVPTVQGRKVRLVMMTCQSLRLLNCLEEHRVTIKKSQEPQLIDNPSLFLGTNIGKLHSVGQRFTTTMLS